MGSSEETEVAMLPTVPSANRPRADFGFGGEVGLRGDFDSSGSAVKAPIGGLARTIEATPRQRADAGGVVSRSVDCCTLDEEGAPPEPTRFPMSPRHRPEVVPCITFLTA
eukprot:RCo002563